MNRILYAIRRINIFIAFLFLLGAHLLMYYLLGTANWFVAALSAALVETAVLSGLQLYAVYKLKAK